MKRLENKEKEAGIGIVFEKKTFCPQVNGYTTVRDRAASAAVGDRMVILGGRDEDGQDLVGFEIYDEAKDEWLPKPEWKMAQGRYRLIQTYILYLG